MCACVCFGGFMSGRCSLLNFSHVIKGRNQTADLNLSVVYSNLLTLCLMVTIIPISSWVTRPRLHLSALSVQYFMNHLLDIKLNTVIATRKWIILCIYANLFNFAPGAHLCFSNISCFRLFFRPTREFLTRMERSPLPVKTFKFDL